MDYGITDYKSEFINIYKENISRDGADKLLDWLTNKSDFFTAPASTRFHSAFEGGLCEHSVKTYYRFIQHLNVEYDGEWEEKISPESAAIIALLHDLCKVNYYKTDYRNVKNENGEWEKRPYFTVDDALPYGHGEKSAYIVSGFLRLTREEAFAIRYHMGFSGTEDPGNVGKALEMFPLAYALVCADMEAAFLMEGKLTPPADAVKP